MCMHCVFMFLNAFVWMCFCVQSVNYYFLYILNTVYVTDEEYLYSKFMKGDYRYSVLINVELCLFSLENLFRLSMCIALRRKFWGGWLNGGGMV